MNMKTILSVMLVLGLCGLARAADEKTNPVGTWKCEYSIGDQQRTATLTITKEAGKLAGTMTWPNQKETKVTDLKQKDAEITFSAVREIGDNKYPVSYTLKIDGDTLKGKGTVEFNGQKNDFDIEGKREKKEK
jgi:hypothetical protein